MAYYAQNTLDKRQIGFTAISVRPTVTKKKYQ